MSGISISTLEIRQESQPVGFSYALSGPLHSATTTTTTTTFICIPIYMGFLYSTGARKFRIKATHSPVYAYRHITPLTTTCERNIGKSSLFKVQQLFVEVHNKQVRTILVRGWWGGGPRGGSVLIKGGTGGALSCWQKCWNLEGLEESWS